VPAVLAVDDGDGGAPVALAGDEPVAQAVLGGRLDGRLREEALAGGGTGEAVVLPAVGQHAVVGVGRAGEIRPGTVDRFDDLLDGEVVCVGEGVVALVVRGDAHDRARAHVVEDVRGDVDRQFRAGQGVDRAQVSFDAVVAVRAVGRTVRASLCRALGVLGDGLVRLGGGRGEFVTRRDGEVGRAVDRVEARGEHVDVGRRVGRVGFGNLERDASPLLAADPVALDVADAVGPPLQVVQRRVEFVGVVGNREEPLVEFAPFDRRLAAPADAAAGVRARAAFGAVGAWRVFAVADFSAVVVRPVDLRVGEDRLAVGTPVDRRAAELDEAGLVELAEQPLVPAVVLGVAGRYLAGPVVAESHRLEFVAHLLDAGAGPGLGVGAALVGGVLGGEAEGVPPHRLEDIVAGHPAVAGVGVSDSVVADVAHVERAGGVGEHSEHVRRVGGVVGTLEGVLGVPDVLPVVPHFLRGVAVPIGHTATLLHPVQKRAGSRPR